VERRGQTDDGVEWGALKNQFVLKEKKSKWFSILVWKSMDKGSWVFFFF
jgi:hypothetical protein